jgi:hypothetical protein
VLTQIMLCLAEAVLRNSKYFCMNPYWISTRKVKQKLWRFNNIYTKRFQWHSNTYVGQKLKKNAHYIFYLHIFISWKKKGGGGSALNAMSSRSSFTK